MRLRLALESFDEAAIFTIHGFCQRALAETAFAAGHAFERELLADQSEMLAGVARDFWRKTMAEATARGESHWVQWLIEIFGGPEGLASQVKSHVGRLDALLEAPSSDSREAAGNEFLLAFAAARTLWQKEGARVLEWMADARLNQRSYPAAKQAGRAAALDQLFAHPPSRLPPFPLPADLAYFGLEKITKARTQASPPPEHPFFAAVDALLAAGARLAAAFDSASRRLLHDFLLAAREELAARKRRSGQQSYDDLLADMAQALQSPAGPALAATLRERYRAALVDEFQDTDPLQLDIFSGIFGQAACPLVWCMWAIPNRRSTAFAAPMCLPTWRHGGRRMRAMPCWKTGVPIRRC